MKIATDGFNLWALGVAFAAFFVGLLVSGIPAALRAGRGKSRLVADVHHSAARLRLLFCCGSARLAATHLLGPLPPTYVFESLRGVLIDDIRRADLMLTRLIRFFSQEPPSALRGCSPRPKRGNLVANGGIEIVCPRPRMPRSPPVPLAPLFVSRRQKGLNLRIRPTRAVVMNMSKLLAQPLPCPLAFPDAPE